MSNNLFGGNMATVQFDFDRYEYFRQSETLTFVSGTTSTKADAIQLNTEYEECIGIATFDISANATPLVWLWGLDYKDGGELQALTIALEWISARINATEPLSRNFAELYKPMQFSIQGSKQNIQHRIKSDGLASDLKLNMVYLLRRKKRV